MSVSTPSSSEEELLDILSPAGLKTGQVRPKKEVHQLGLWHATVHLWICDPLKGLLSQQRSANKKMNPGLWDFSAAGHVDHGETLLQAALRELQEETALVLKATDLHYLGVEISENHYPGNLIDREFNHLFSFTGKIEEETLQAQEAEVSAIRFVSYEQLQKEWQKQTAQWVSHSEHYYQKLGRFVESSEVSPPKNQDSPLHS